MKKTDIQLKQQIEEELRFDPKVNAAQIGVSVDNSMVSLLGAVDTYAQKWAAEDAAKRVSGVRAVAQELTVKLHAKHQRTDAEVGAAVLEAFKWNVQVPTLVTATVARGEVTLEGHVTWKFQRDAAEQAARYLTGVKGIYNLIKIKVADVAPGDVKEKVLAALRRQAATDTSTINVDTAGGKVTLTGHASSWQTIEDAANAAWAAPGVTEVIDQVSMSF